VHLAAPLAVNRTYLSKLEKGRELSGTGDHRQAGDGAGGGAGRAAEDIQRAEHVTLQWQQEALQHAQGGLAAQVFVMGGN
jgi:hypothetical protein